MEEIPARELRNDVSRVLRRVEAGERLRVTLNGRPVADLVPIDPRPRFMSWEEFVSSGAQADPGLADELAEMLPDTTDDVPIRE